MQMQLFKHDLIEGIWRRKQYFLLAVFVSLLSCIGLHQTIRNLSLTMEVGNGSVMDYWVYLTMCGKEYKLDLFSFFQVPVRWICLQMFALICIGNYLLDDMQQWGYQVILRSRDRIWWWISKIIWCVSLIICYYVICFLVTGIYAFLHEADWNIHPNLAIMRAACKVGFAKCSIQRLLFISVIQPILLSVFLALLQIVLHLLIEPMHAFVILFCILVVSTYHKSWVLVGNWGMPYRMYPIEKSGFDPDTCLFMICIGIIFCSTLGCLLFQKKDILESR
ncbi:MAG: hypothetical protein K2J67_06645 [Lachnospiraceae bacterium]|nr:hypothetical protein [Lachnospiraceae bacterium]